VRYPQRRERHKQPPPEQPLGQGRDLEGEVRLAAMFLHQLVLDARSVNEKVREEAVHFLEDRGAIEFWLDLIGIDHGTFTSRMRTFVTRSGRGAAQHV